MTLWNVGKSVLLELKPMGILNVGFQAKKTCMFAGIVVQGGSRRKEHHVFPGNVLVEPIMSKKLTLNRHATTVLLANTALSTARRKALPEPHVSPV